MMLATSNPTKDESNFRSEIQRQLRNGGVFDEITASVRARILLSLNNIPSAAAHPGSSVLNDTAFSRSTADIEEMAIQSLVYDYLEQRRMKHTLSVFSAESGIECRKRLQHGTYSIATPSSISSSPTVPISVDDAIKALRLDGFLNDWRIAKGEESTSLSPPKASPDEPNTDSFNVALPFLLRTMARWLSSKTKQKTTQSFSRTSTTITYTDKLVQTEEWRDSQATNEKEHSLNSSKSIEQRLIGIRRECEQQMKQEMHEKLRLSAKKQAVEAMKRLEQKHKDQIESLHRQIETERTAAQRREDEMLESLSRMKIATQQETKEAARRIEVLALEKQKLEGEMKMLQQRRLKEWTEEHETIVTSTKELNEQRRQLRKEINDFRAKEIKFASLEHERNSILSELASLQGEKHIMFKNEENLRQHLSRKHLEVAQLKQDLQKFELERSTIQSELSEIMGRYEGARSDLEKTSSALDAARDEATGLRDLLRQSQSALESISFGEEDNPHRQDQTRRSEMTKLSYLGRDSWTSIPLPSSDVKTSPPKITHVEKTPALDERTHKAVNSRQEDPPCHCDPPDNMTESDLRNATSSPKQHDHTVCVFHNGIRHPMQNQATNMNLSKSQNKYLHVEDDLSQLTQHKRFGGFKNTLIDVDSEENNRNVPVSDEGEQGEENQPNEVNQKKKTLQISTTSLSSVVLYSEQYSESFETHGSSIKEKPRNENDDSIVSKSGVTSPKQNISDSPLSTYSSSVYSIGSFCSAEKHELNSNSTSPEW